MVLTILNGDETICRSLGQVTVLVSLKQHMRSHCLISFTRRDRKAVSRP